MHSALSGLGLTSPVLAAPMAGGGSTPALVIAAAKAGGFGFVAAGYKTPAALAEQIGQVRAAGVLFGVNLFAPNPVPVDRQAYREYADLLRAEADRYGVDVSDVEATEDDDHWQDKIDLLLAEPVPVVSFTFGLPEEATVAALRAAGTLVVQTVTSAEEARAAADRGVDLLAVQASAAGGHSGTLTPDRIPPEIPLPQLLGEVGAAVRLPLIAAGGIATPTAVGAALAAGADAVSVGTVLLRSDESGASAPHRDALADTRRRCTVITRAFTGRPARGLRNEFTDRYTAEAPAGYPALHHLTSPIRKAAAAAGDPERINLWAGTGYHNAAAEPATRILTGLTRRLWL
ncbi:nitronate monooxygenase [Herbidospora galbida]|uniref:Propionate 3-nitronate monooxygenase n=1 Tax=Herbidospora galbida TaxID=2575442 RepID=A0A4U3MPV5_9ACTN|nr:nitronate monooxygenase [Herbidospora galbida]TKK91685.1 nitronate monooxygenase [Herbidospora galbida]